MKSNNKKGSLELSVNSIVILIIAIAILGLALGFIKANFGSLSQKLEQSTAEIPDAPMATASEPITIHSENLIVGKGQQVPVKFSVYCPEDTGECVNTMIDIDKCDEAFSKIDQIEKNINAGRTQQFNTLIIFSGTSGQTYLCSAVFTYEGLTEPYTKTADFAVKII
ncbi:hypothetical protein JW949_00585 [Candidatus Woesearchaeota archaeon]|nr:hypothetical protein [Candidatus Woesearchaeota archaeon]